MARFYRGINVADIADNYSDIEFLHSMIEPVYSYELLYENWSELSAEGVLELAKKATGDQLEAERLWSKRYLEIDAEKRRAEAKGGL